MTRARDDDEKSELSQMLGVRVSADDVARLDALVARFPIIKRHTAARQALRLGLSLIERDASLLFGAVDPHETKSGPKPRGGKR